MASFCLAYLFGKWYSFCQNSLNLGFYVKTNSDDNRGIPGRGLFFPEITPPWISGTHNKGNTTQKHVLRPPRRLPNPTQWCLGPKRQVQQLLGCFSGTPLHAKSSKVTCLPTKSSLAGTQKQSETQKHRHVFDARSAAQSPLLHAPGARMTVVELTPSNKAAKPPTSESHLSKYIRWVFM